MSTAIKMFFSQVVIEKGIPFQPTRDPKKIRARWDREAEEAIKSGKSYDNIEDLLKDII
jgi:addiction module RelB/DinJ family antitoxin